VLLPITLLPSLARAHVLSADATGRPDLGVAPEPWVLALLAISLVLYLAGYARLRGRRSHGAAPGEGGRARHRQLLAFLGGWVALCIALASPLDALGGVLFSAHMVQHEMLMIVAAPLLVMGRPLAVWLWAFPHRWRRPVAQAWRWPPLLRTWHLATGALAAWLLHAAALWLWHVPRFFQAALADPAIHALQHASFLASALLFWWTVFGRASEAQGASNAHAMLSLFTTMVHTGALGALLTLAPAMWYPSCIESTLALGFDPLQDQQLGGLVMWVPGGLAYLIGGLMIGARWLSRRPVRNMTSVASSAARLSAHEES
jgi:cytochrome c oxidase assembly factor CtaG